MLVRLNTKHGHAKRGQVSATYVTWQSMIRRCTDPQNIRYALYGGRGITVCPRWRNSFEDFLADMGPRPVGRSIDRINVDGNYEPNNCRWATDSEQRRNKRRKQAA